jgi:serpin B
MKLREDFAADAAAEDAMGIRRVDYRRDAAAALATINAAVASATRRRIANLLSRSDITTKTRVTLTNALYWKGCWLEPFNERTTELAPFALADGGSALVRMMYQKNHFRALQRDGAKAIMLPFLTGRPDRGVSMVVILPDEADALPRLEAALDDSGLADWLRDLDKAEGRHTHLALPRMRLNWREDLAPTLRAMGLSMPFDGAADFSGMAILPDPADPGASSLEIGNVIHQTVFEVDEHGCEAAAATALVTRGIAFALPSPFEFRADRPFLFLLRDDCSGLILFIGRHMVPEPPQAGDEVS